VRFIPHHAPDATATAAGVIAQETPLSSCIRRWLSDHPDAARELFGGSRLPTLAQYDPLNRYLETHPGDGTIVVTSLPGPARAAALEEAASGTAGCPHAAGAGAAAAGKSAAAAVGGAGSASGGGAGACRLRGAPLIRYCIGDSGGVMGFNEVIAFLRGRGYNPLAEGDR
jgi:hypothetical protein